MAEVAMLKQLFEEILATDRRTATRTGRICAI